ncbi:MAG: DnaA/Hda family protein [Alphaproteobacteria bacterium]|nr:DnaA/Hda family protein [Alphaproteobacteria bacterium]
MPQLPLQLAMPPVYLEQNFLRSGSNHEALEWVLRWPSWPSNALLIDGDEGSGKTHLGHIWAARAAASKTPLTEPALASHALIDDIEHYDETLLFHLLNIAREKQLSLLLTASKPAGQLDIRLPDLASRLKALPAATIRAPDDELLAAIMRKQFSDRQLMVDDEVIKFLVPRVERSFEAAARLVERIDEQSLSQHRRITIPFVRTMTLVD